MFSNSTPTFSNKGRHQLHPLVHARQVPRHALLPALRQHPFLHERHVRAHPPRTRGNPQEYQYPDSEQPVEVLADVGVGTLLVIVLGLGLGHKEDERQEGEVGLEMMKSKNFSNEFAIIER